MKPTTSRPKTTPRDVYLHILATVTLYISLVAVIALMFNYIDIWLPDPLDYSYDRSSSIASAMASLVVAWPIYVLIMSVLSKDIKKDPGNAQKPVRKWLFYLTLFVASVTVIIDLITLFHTFFTGDLTTRFLCKTLTVLAVAGGVFSYYLWELRREVRKQQLRSKIDAIIVSVILVVIVVLGFVTQGSPMTQRLKRFDTQRVQDLQNISYNINSYFGQNDRLPTSLAAFKDYYGGSIMDPETMTPYSYSIVTSDSYQLCANFNLPEDQVAPWRNTPQQCVKRDDFIKPHGQGEHCYTVEIDPNDSICYPKGI